MENKIVSVRLTAKQKDQLDDICVTYQESEGDMIRRLIVERYRRKWSKGSQGKPNGGKYALKAVAKRGNKIY